MKKIYLSIFAVAALFALACNKESVKDSQEAPVKGSVFTIKASMDEATKTAYAGGKTFSWAAGDQIAVEISDGQYADFATFSTSTSAAVADFSGEVPDYFRPYEYAVYPASINPTFLSNGLITVDLPLEYDTRGLEDPLSILPLIAKNDGNDNYAFHHATGVLKVSFTNIPEGACELYLRANNQAIAGSYYINLGEVGEDYAQYEQIIADGWWEEGTAYLITSVYFDRPSSGEASIYVPIPVGTLNAGLQISLLDESGSTLFSKTTTKDISLARKQIVELPVLDADVWQPLGTAKFNHIYFSGEYDYSVDVPIQYNTEDPNKFRLVNPYGILLPSLGITQASEPSEYLSFTLLQPGDKVYGTTITMNGLVDFDPVYTGYSANNYFMAHPSYLTGFEDEQQYIYNRVIKYQEDGKPANIELDGHRLYTLSGSLYGSYCWNENLVMQIAFPGYDILDYSADIGAIAPNAASTAASPLIDAEIVFGADTKYALVAAAADEAEAFAAIGAGNGVQVNAAGIATLTLPANAETGVYYVAVVSYAEGQPWIQVSKKFNYVNPDAALLTVDDIVGEYTVTASPLTNGSDSEFDMIIAASDNSSYNVMITRFDGVNCTTSNIYGTFSPTTNTVFFAADQFFYTSSSYYYGLRAYDTPYDLTFDVLGAGKLSTDQWVVFGAYNKSTGAYLGYFDVWADFVAERNASASTSSFAPKPKSVSASAGKGRPSTAVIPSRIAESISPETAVRAR